MQVKNRVTIRVPEGEGAAFHKVWRECVGSERLSTALQKEYLDHLDIANETQQYKYLRCHGLFSDDLGIFRMREWDGKKVPVYNFTNLDRVFDALLARNIRPFVELGFMPADMASGPDTIFYWKGIITPPSDYALWEELVERFVRHCIERWGIDEVLTWYFEVWNEPNLVNFWKNADMEEYFKLYDCSVRVIKNIDPRLRVGGPAISGGSDHWIDGFLNHVRKNGIACDFFSRHMYAGKPPKRRTPELLYQELTEPVAMVDELKEVRKHIDDLGFKNLPLHITEFNSSYSPICPVHDTALNAAFLARLLSECGDYAATMSFWTFSDVFDENDIPRSQFHGGFGTVGLNGVLKPSFHLFEFFTRLGDRHLHRGDNIIVTKKRDGSFAVAAWNPVQQPDGKGEQSLGLDLEMRLPAGEYVCTRSRVSDEYANPWAAWVEMGRPRYPSREQLRILRAVAQPKVEVNRVHSNGTLAHSIILGRNELSLVEFYPLKNESGSYMGLDDSMIDGYTHKT